MNLMNAILISLKSMAHFYCGEILVEHPVQGRCRIKCLLRLESLQNFSKEI
jgi:hypothetical protein